MILVFASRTGLFVDIFTDVWAAKCDITSGSNDFIIFEIVESVISRFSKLALEFRLFEFPVDKSSMTSTL